MSRDGLYTARGQDDVQDVQVSREAMDGRQRLAGAVNKSKFH
jgi:hypothetical protein